LLPPLVFVILYRVPFDAAKGWRRERHEVYLTNLALGAQTRCGGDRCIAGRLFASL
jgi:hypothetical protein